MSSGVPLIPVVLLALVAAGISIPLIIVFSPQPPPFAQLQVDQSYQRLSASAIVVSVTLSNTGTDLLMGVASTNSPFIVGELHVGQAYSFSYPLNVTGTALLEEMAHGTGKLTMKSVMATHVLHVE